MAANETAKPAGGKVALVTGARTGIGLELTKRLLAEGWQVAALVRAPLAAEGVVARAAEEGRLRTYLADISDFAALRRAAGEIAAREPVIDVLFNNAGVSPERALLSPQGRELCFDVNTVAPFILARALTPPLAASGQGRIVNTSSNSLLSVKRFDPARLAHPAGRYRKLFGPYARSKLALSLWTEAAAADFAAKGVSILSACPGPNKSPMTAASGMPWALKMIGKLAFHHPSTGAARLHAAAFTEPPAPDGSFLIKNKPRDLPFREKAAEVLALMESSAGEG